MTSPATTDPQRLWLAITDPSVDWTSPGAYDRLFVKARELSVSPEILAPLEQNFSDTKARLFRMTPDELEAHANRMESYRDKVRAILSFEDAAKQQECWHQQMSHAEQQGFIQPGQVSHQYPGCEQAAIFMNHFAQESLLAKEFRQLNTSWLEGNGSVQ